MSTETESGKKLKSEIDRRARDTTKLIALEAQKVAIGEMVLERLDTILDLLRAAGFKIVKTTTPAVQAVPPPNTVVVQASQLAEQTTAPVKNPARCAAWKPPTPIRCPMGARNFIAALTRNSAPRRRPKSSRPRASSTATPAPCSLARRIPTAPRRQR